MGTLKGGTPLTPDESPGHAEVAWQAFWGGWKSEGSARTKAPLSRGVQRLPAGVRRVGRGKADYGCGAATVRSAGGGGALDGHQKEARTGTAVLRARDPWSLFCLGERSLDTIPGCHFVAWPPFRAAEEAGRAGRGGRSSQGRGRRVGGGARAPLPPPVAQASRSPLFFASGLESPAAGSPAARPECASCARRVNPWKAAERRARSPDLVRPLKPFQSGISPPHPCYVKGIHFMKQCSELNRGKLEFLPEKEGAFGSPVLVGVAHSFASPALNHNGVLHTEVNTARLRQWETQQRCQTPM